MLTLVPCRARPLPPDERRAALVDATIPLLTLHGPGVSTRQIAEAAGVAEGTIFGVFPDKQALIRAAVDAAFDPAPVVDQLAAIDRDASFVDTVTAAVQIMQDRLSRVFHLMVALGLHHPPHPGQSSHQREPQARILDALTALLARHEDALRVDPDHCARLLRLLAFAGSNPRLAGENPLSTSEMVDVLLNGVAAHDVTSPAAHAVHASAAHDVTSAAGHPSAGPEQSC